MSVKIVKPQEVDPEFRKAKEERERLESKKAELLRRVADARNRGQAEDAAKVSLELKDVAAALRDGESEHDLLKRRARTLARQRLNEDGAYRQLIIKAVGVLADRLAAWLPLHAIRQEAGQYGIVLPVLPGPIVGEIEAAEGWLKAQVHAGVLDAATLPPVLRSLVEVKS